jgi:hypothetical protein
VERGEREDERGEREDERGERGGGSRVVDDGSKRIPSGLGADRIVHVSARNKLPLGV